MRTIRPALAAAALALALSGCAAVSAVGTAADVVGTAVSTTADVAGAAVDAALPEDECKDGHDADGNSC
jgi:hypothetical protein